MDDVVSRAAGSDQQLVPCPAPAAPAVPRSALPPGSR